MSGKGSIELATAYVSIVPSLKGASRSISSQLGDVDTSGAGRKIGSSLSDDVAKSVDMGGVSEKLDTAASRFADFGGKAAGVGDVLTAGVTLPLAAAGSAALVSASDFDSAGAKIEAACGGANDAARNLEETGRTLYTDGWGESMTQLSDSLITAREVLGDLSQTDMTYAVKGAMTLEQAYGSDLSETLRGTRVLMDKFGLSATEATDLMVAGTQRGLDYTGELGDNLAEYSGRWADAGVSASEYFSLLEAGADNGAYQLDKVGDFLNEFLTSLSDGRMEEGIGNFSKETQATFDAFKSGGADAQDVLDAVVGELAAMPDGYKKSQVASQLWSSLGEDNAMSMITALSGVDDTFSDVGGAAQKAADDISDSLESRAAAALHTAQEAVEPFASVAVDMLGDAADAAKGLAEGFSKLDGGTQRLIVGAAGVVAAAGPVLSVGGRIASGAGKLVSVLGKVSPKAKGALSKVAPMLAGVADAAASAADGTDRASSSMGKAAGASGKLASASSMLKGGMVGLAMGGVAVLVGVFADYLRKQEQFKAATEGLDAAVAGSTGTFSAASGEMQAYAGSAQTATQMLNSAVESQAAFAQEVMGRNAEVASSAAEVQRYGDVIQQLAGKADLSKADVANLQVAVDGLNDACGTNYTVAKDAGGAYQVMSNGAKVAKSSIDELVAAQEAQMRLEANKENVQEAYNRQAEAAEALAKAQSELARAQADYDYAVENNLPNQNAYAQSVLRAQQNVDKCQEAYDSASNAVNSFSEQQTLAQMAVGENADAWAQLITNSQMLTAGLEQSGKSIIDFRDQLEQTGVSAQTLASLSDEQLMKLGSSYDGTIGSITDTLAQFATDSAFLGTDSGKKFASGLASQKESALQAAAEVSGMSVAELEKSAKQAGYQGDAAVAAYALGIANGKTPAKSKASAVADSAKDGLKKNNSKARGWGSELSENFARGIGSMGSVVADAAKRIAEKASGYLHHSTPDVGPLKNDDEWGYELARNFASSMREGTPLVSMAAEGMAQAADVALGVGSSPSAAYGVPAAVSAQGAYADSMLQRIHDDLVAIYGVIPEGMDQQTFGRMTRKAVAYGI